MVFYSAAISGIKNVFTSLMCLVYTHVSVQYLYIANNTYVALVDRDKCMPLAFDDGDHSVYLLPM